MEATKKHREFTNELTDLINRFHKENPDLFVNNIDVVKATYANGMAEFAGVRVEIVVQPTNR